MYCSKLHYEIRIRVNYYVGYVGVINDNLYLEVPRFSALGIAATSFCCTKDIAESPTRSWERETPKNYDI